MLSLAAMSQATPALRACTRHPEALAGWRCDRCAADLCPHCAAAAVGGAPVCATCGDLVRVLLAPRGLVLPFARSWRPVALEVLSFRGATQVVVLACALQLLFALPPRLWALARALELGWVLFLARRAGVGFGVFGRPRYVDLWSVWVGPVPRTVVGALPVLGGALALSALGRVAPAATSPWLWLLVALAVVLLPPVLVAASVEGEGRQVPWPWRLPACFRRLGPDLRPLQLAVLVGAAAEAVAAAQPPFDGEDVHLDLHILEAFLPHLLSLGALGVAGALAGHLVFTRASELGHEAAGSDLLPALAEPPQGLFVRLSPEEVAAAALARARRFEPLELDDPESRLARALDAGEGAEALTLLDAGARVGELGAGQRVALAQLLAGRGEAARAADLLRATLRRAGEAREPRTLVILARLCAERLGATTEAAGLYREVLALAPGSAAADYARAQLDALEGPLLDAVVEGPEQA
jgi:tetratricopeptide (TPR) repeat protein